jgi:hypothetical protein
MIERVKESIKDAERLLYDVEVELSIAIESRNIDKAHIYAAAKIGLLGEIHDLKVDLFKRELSEIK